MNYEVRPDGELSQGDILRGIHVITENRGTEGTEVKSGTSNIIVISQNCEIDKAIKRSSAPLSVASVVSLETVPKGEQGNIRKYKVLSMFYLPDGEGLPLECYIDWRTLQPVDYAALLVARKSSYVCSLTGDMLKAAQERFWDFYFRPRPFGER